MDHFQDQTVCLPEGNNDITTPISPLFYHHWGLLLARWPHAVALAKSLGGLEMTVQTIVYQIIHLVYVCMYVCMYIYIYVCVCVAYITYIHIMYIYIHIYIQIYIYICYTLSMVLAICKCGACC